MKKITNRLKIGEILIRVPSGWELVRECLTYTCEYYSVVIPIFLIDGLVRHFINGGDSLSSFLYIPHGVSISIGYWPYLFAKLLYFSVNRREEERHSHFSNMEIVVGEESIPANTINMSDNGARINISKRIALELGQRLKIKNHFLKHHYQYASVRWFNTKTNEIGLRTFF